ncbi:MAG: FAD-dependent oxidoreductase [Bacillota bacterium]
MKILIIGAVAAGTSAAAKARRNTEDAQITVYEKDSYISYSGCGMPYFLGGHVESIDALAPRDPQFFKSKYNVDIKTRHEVLEIDATAKTLKIKNLDNGEIFTDSFDKLIIATGAKSVIPTIKTAGGTAGANAFALRNINDLIKIAAFIDEHKPKSALIVGTGYIGLEMCENLTERGIEVSMVEKLPQVCPSLDEDMARLVQKRLEAHGVRVSTGVEVELADADLVILATGVRPEVSLAQNAGIAIGATGAIAVNAKMQTNHPDIYACGDCIEQFNSVTGRAIYRPLGSTANKTGRIAGDSATGGDLEFRGVLGTGIFQIFGLSVAQTGLSEREAREQGFEVAVCHNIKPGKPEYMGGTEMVIKAIAQKSDDAKLDGRLLGVQIVGEDGVDKRIDVFVTAMSFGAKALDLEHLDLAYAPPFSTTKDPVMYTGMILENSLHRGRELITSAELKTRIEAGEKLQIIDARVAAQFEKDHIGGAENVPLERLRDAADALDRDITTVTYCNKGVSGNAAQNVLINKGVKKVYNLSGGRKSFN